MAEVERQLEAERTRGGATAIGTSSATRTRLAFVEKELAEAKNVAGPAATSTRTRDLLDEKMRQLEKLRQDSSTTTRTREMLSKIKKEVDEEREKLTTSKTRAEYERQQFLLR